MIKIVSSLILLICATTIVAFDCFVTGKNSKGEDMTVDLTPLQKQDGVYEAYEDNFWWKHLINVCAETAKCDSKPGQYAQIQVDDWGTECNVVGKLEGSSLSLIDPNDIDKGVRLKYVGGDEGRSSRIDFICEPQGGDGQPRYVETIGMEYQFEWRSAKACPTAAAPPSKRGGSKIPGLGWGGLILVIVVSLLILYFVGGALYAKFALKKEGKDIIPHYSFWSELPFVVKDGISFAIEGLSRLFKRGQYTAV